MSQSNRSIKHFDQRNANYMWRFETCSVHLKEAWQKCEGEGSGNFNSGREMLKRMLLSSFSFIGLLHSSFSPFMVCLCVSVPILAAYSVRKYSFYLFFLLLCHNFFNYYYYYYLFISFPLQREDIWGTWGHFGSSSQLHRTVWGVKLGFKVELRGSLGWLG